MGDALACVRTSEREQGKRKAQLPVQFSRAGDRIAETHTLLKLRVIAFLHSYPSSICYNNVHAAGISDGHQAFLRIHLSELPLTIWVNRLNSQTLGQGRLQLEV